MRTITRKSYERTATHPQLGGTRTNLLYTEVLNADGVVIDNEYYPAKTYVLFSTVTIDPRG